MGQIQSSVGLVTGIPIQETVDQLMAVNALPRVRLESRTSLLQQEQVAITELMTLVVGVQFTTDRLGQESLYSATTVASSRSNALSAVSTGSPKPGSYSFTPVRLAQSQQLASSLLASSDQTLSEGEIVIHTGGFLDESVNLDALNGGAGVSRGSIRITDRSGNSDIIDLRFAQTAQDVVDAINTADNIRVVADIDGDHFSLSDVSGGAVSNLEVEDVSGGTTALDLGLAGISTSDTEASGNGVYSLSLATGLNSLLDGRGVNFPTNGEALEFQLQDGSTITLTSELNGRTASLGQLIDEINQVGEGQLQARLGADGSSLEIEDLTVGGSTFAVTSPSGDLAQQLGLDNPSNAGVITSDRLIGGLNDVLLSSLAGGSGLTELGQISITDRSGASDTIDLSGAETLDDLIDTINASSVGVTAQLNRTRTGIEVIDTTGNSAQDLIIADADATNSASALNIAGQVAGDSIDSGSLHRQFVTHNTLLDDFNQGRGVNLGVIQFTDSSGTTSALSLSTLEPQTIGDVIDAINDLETDVLARINETGDGIVIVDQAGGEGELTVEDSAGGTAASDLGIAGTGQSLTLDQADVVGIDGTRTIRIATDPETTVAQLAEQINALSQSPISASLLNLNSSGGVRLLLNGSTTGRQGRVAIDSQVGLSFSETTQARDALLAFGANETSGGVLVSSATNTFSGLVEDLEFTVKEASDSPVTVTVSENDSNITKQVETFVEQFNGLRDRLDEFTAFDEATNSVGILFGKSSSLRVDLAYGRLFSGAFSGAGEIQSLGRLGISLNENGKLEFDKSKFEGELETNRAAVQEFFTKEDDGFSAQSKAVADSLASVETGSLLNRTTTLATQIEQNTRRIASFDLRLERQRERLLNQFFTMETTIARLQQDLTALNQLQIIPPNSLASAGGVG